MQFLEKKSDSITCKEFMKALDVYFYHFPILNRLESLFQVNEHVQVEYESVEVNSLEVNSTELDEKIKDEITESELNQILFEYYPKQDSIEFKSIKDVMLHCMNTRESLKNVEVVLYEVWNIFHSF